MTSWPVVGKFWNKRSVTITEYDPTFKVVYLGNVLTPWAKGEGCVDKPLLTLWKNYCSNVKRDINMKLTVCNSGLKAVTKEHGLTEYWAGRITYCAYHGGYPRVFCWIYRHEGKRMKQELRCHAALCAKEETARQMVVLLNHRLTSALQEFKREKLSRQKARLSLGHNSNCVPRRKVLLSTGSVNFRPPLERSRSAPKLTAIEEDVEDDDEEPDEDFVFSESVDLDSLSDEHCGSSLDSDSVEEVPDPLPRRRPLNSINETADEESDNVSDESGYYAEEKM